MNIKTPENLIYGYKGTFTGNILTLQNLKIPKITEQQFIRYQFLLILIIL